MDINDAFNVWYNDEYLFGRHNHYRRSSYSYNSCMKLFTEYWKAEKKPYAVLYRGLIFVLPYQQDEYEKLNRKMQTGIYSDKGFFSTSLSMEYAIEMVYWFKDYYVKQGKNKDVQFLIFYLIFENAEGVYIETEEEEVVVFNPVYRIKNVYQELVDEDLCTVITGEHL